MNREIKQIIRNRTERIVESGDCQSDDNGTLLDTIIQARMNDGKVTRMKEIQAFVNIVLLAGYDTTKTTLSWCLYLLGHHQSIQQRLHEEIRQFLDQLNERQEEITIMNMKGLKFLESCIYETLRLYPPGVVIGRRARRTVMLSNTLSIPAGVDVLFHFWRINRDPKYYKQPNVFNPERFLTDDHLAINQQPLRSVFFPFSGGIRSCIGREYAMMQMRLFLINIINRYELRSMDNYGDASPQMNFLHPAAQFPIQFERRT